MKCVIIFLLTFVSLVGIAQKNQATEVLQFKILHYKTPCWGESIRLCYLVENKAGKTENFYSAIEGFEYEWGYNYELLVEQFEIKAPKADGSSIGFRLKKQISKEKVAADLRFELPLELNGYHIVASDGKNCLYFGAVPINTGSVSCEELTVGKTGVFQHADGGLRLVEMR